MKRKFTTKLAAIGRTFATTLALATVLAFGAGQLAGCPLVFVINFSGQFGVMDLATGAFMPVGKGSDNVPAGIAGVPGGPFYAIDAVTGHLLRINREGSVSDVGDTMTGPSSAPNGISIFGALADGTLYALDFTNRLFKINSDTAALTPLGTLSSLPPQESDYSGNMMTSMAGDGKYLYFSIEIPEGPKKTGPTMFIIDPVKLTATSKPLKGVKQAIGSGIINGNLFLFGSYGQIYKTDPVTGDAEVVSIYDSGITDFDPPVTGIFGAVGTVEPYAIRRLTPAVESEAEKGRQHWPARHAPRRNR